MRLSLYECKEVGEITYYLNSDQSWVGVHLFRPSPPQSMAI